MASSVGADVSLIRDRLDVRAILTWIAALFAALYTVQGPLEVVAVAASVWLIVVATLRSAEYRMYALLAAVTGVGTALLNPLVSRAGTTVLYSGPSLPGVGRVDISVEAVVFGMVMAIRLAGVFGVFALFSALVDADELYRFASPYSVAAALVVSLSIRLLPVTVRDARLLGEAMSARGVALDSGRFADRVRARMPLMGALAMTSMDRAMNLAEALESRGYGRAGRTRLRRVPLTMRDFVWLGLSLLVCVAVAWRAWAGSFSYYPVLQAVSGPSRVAGAIALAVVVVLPLAFEGGWRMWLSSLSKT